jgi:putative FmdB family regulatory protein
MPTYEYECLKCSHEFECFQNMSEEPLQTCPECKGKVHRKIGMGAGIIFKGSGFYETDYKRGKEYNEAAKKDRDAEKVSASTDSKPKKSEKPSSKKKDD